VNAGDTDEKSARHAVWSACALCEPWARAAPTCSKDAAAPLDDHLRGVKRSGEERSGVEMRFAKRGVKMRSEEMRSGVHLRRGEV
jgi:hypothetical protein